MASNRKQESRRKHIVHMSAWDKEKNDFIPPKNLMEFGPHHFPVGTRFRISDQASFGGKGDEHVVTDVVTNGARSYVLKTTTLMRRYSTTDAFGHFERMGCNISWVEAIIERGKGPLVRTRLHDYGDVLTAGDIHEARNFAREVGLRVGKNDYCWFTHNRYHIVSMAAQFTRQDAWIDAGKLLGAMERQGWLYTRPGFYAAFYVVPKKQFKAWLRRNVNRFLVNLNEQEDQEAEDMAEEMSRLHSELDEALDAYDAYDEGYEDNPIKDLHEEYHGDDYPRVAPAPDDIGAQNDRLVVELNGVAFDEFEDDADDETFALKA